MPTDRTDRRSDDHYADPGTEAGTHRSRFAQDRDRLLYSAEFRRLAGITQVVRAGEGPAFHNRLTHSIKVAQVGRRLAEFLRKRDSKHVEAVGGVEPEVVEAACLAHDIGHPPFGHAAETALQEAMEKEGFTDSFEGNAQSFRIVTFLSARRSNGLGLDLTRATMNAVIKYPTLRGEDTSIEKWNAYEEDKEAYEYARELSGGDPRKSVEAELMDWSDDVSYATHDLEDFYRAGVIPLDQLFNDVGRDELIQSLRDKWLKRKGQKKKWAKSSDFSDRVARVFEEAAGLFPALRRPFEARREQDEQLHRLTSHFLGRFLNAYAGRRPILLNPDAADDSKQKWVRKLPEAEFEVTLLKSVTAHYVFENPVLVAQQDGQKRIVKVLFKAFYKAFQGERAHLVPTSFAHLREWCAGDDAERRCARAAADVVSSLTEDQAHRLFLRLRGINPGSLHDPIMR